MSIWACYLNVYVLESLMYSCVSYQILGKSSTDVVQRIKKALPRLPPVQIARDGTIMEWVSFFLFLYLPGDYIDLFNFIIYLSFMHRRKILRILRFITDMYPICLVFILGIPWHWSKHLTSAKLLPIASIKEVPFCCIKSAVLVFYPFYEVFSL